MRWPRRGKNPSLKPLPQIETEGETEREITCEREGETEREIIAGGEEGEKAPIWIHCASGEFEYAKPLIRQWKASQPHCPILVTYFSPSYRKPIETDPLVDLSVPLPLDLPGPCHSFLRHYRPRALFIARTDLWPELLHQCRRMGLPCYLFSASFQQLRPLHKVFGFYYRWIWGHLNLIGVINSVDFKNFKSMGVSEEKLKVCGDTRYDQVFYRLENPRSSLQSPKGLATTAPTPTLVAGSTWPVDEVKLLEGAATLVQNGKLHLIVAPHEPTRQHLLNFEKMMSHHKLDFRPLSQWKYWKKGEVLLVDQMGLLAEIYPWADFAFVGGSFHRKVHSVMEPLAAGCIGFVGPKHMNNAEAMEFKAQKLRSMRVSQLNVVNVFNTGNELKALLHRAMAKELKGAKSSKELSSDSEELSPDSEELSPNSVELNSKSLGLKSPKDEIIDLMKSRRGSSRKIVQWPLHSE